MADKKVAFVCPIYDSRNHFDYGSELLKSKTIHKIAADFYLIFSNEEQKIKFENNMDDFCRNDFCWLILPDEDRNYKSQVTVKKFFGLAQLMKRYEYIVTIDSESKFIRHVNIEEECKKIWNKKTFLNSNVSPDGFGIMRSCFKTLGLYQNKLLRKETGNYRYNVWFNELPVYKSSLLPEFFIWLSGLNNTKFKDSWYCFDYYIFIAFLIIEKGYKLNKFKYESLGGIVEYLYVFDEEKRKEISDKFGTHWASSDTCLNSKTFILFHLDRDMESEAYHINDFKKHIQISKRRRILLLIKDFFMRNMI